MEYIKCYSEDNTKRLRLGDMDCLENHEQYICGTYDRGICIDENPERNLRRWNFSFQTFGVAKLICKKVLKK